MKNVPPAILSEDVSAKILRIADRADFSFSRDSYDGFEKLPDRTNRLIAHRNEGKNITRYLFMMKPGLSEYVFIEEDISPNADAARTVLKVSPSEEMGKSEEVNELKHLLIRKFDEDKTEVDPACIHAEPGSVPETRHARKNFFTETDVILDHYQILGWDICMARDQWEDHSDVYAIDLNTGEIDSIDGSSMGGSNISWYLQEHLRFREDDFKHWLLSQRCNRDGNIEYGCTSTFNRHVITEKQKKLLLQINKDNYREILAKVQMLAQRFDGWTV